MAPRLSPAASCALVYFVPVGAQLPAYLEDPGFRLASKAPAIGPDGNAGQLVSPLADAGSLDVIDGLHWFPIAGNVRFGIFQSPEPAFAPEQLARATMRPGHWVTLGDGRKWLIPVARLAFGGPGLPRRRAILPDGTIGWQVDEAYRELSQFAASAWAGMNGEPNEITEADVDRFCAQALGINYRIGLLEAVALGLFTDDGLRGIVNALVDGPEVARILRHAEKKD